MENFTDILQTGEDYSQNEESLLAYCSGVDQEDRSRLNNITVWVIGATCSIVVLSSVLLLMFSNPDKREHPR
jgi:hypothetical protein